MVLCFGLSGYTQEVATPNSGIKAYFNEARTYHHQDRMDEALNALDMAAELAEKLEDEKALIDAYHEFALLYLDMEKADNGTFYRERAKVLLNNMAYLSGEAMNNFVEAKFLYAQENYYQSIFILDKAKELSNDRNLLNNVVLLEAEIYSSIDKFDTASKNFSSLLVNNDPLEQAYLQVRAHMGLAQLYQQNEDYEESVKNAESALEIAIANGFSKWIYKANELLEYGYEKLGRYDRSLEYSRNLLSIKDSVFNLGQVC